jgi:hypothetical protein
VTDAEAELRRAVEKVAVERGGEPGDVLGDFVVLTTWRRLEDDGRVTYPVEILPETVGVPEHVARGIISYAVDIMTAQAVNAVLGD